MSPSRARQRCAGIAADRGRVALALALVVALAALCTTAAPASAATFVRSWGSFGSGHGQFFHPKGVAVDAHGHVYAADTNNNRIGKVTADSAFLPALRSSG